MRIIDKKKDYYDYLVGKFGIDTDIIFDRRDFTMLKDDWNFQHISDKEYYVGAIKKYWVIDCDYSDDFRDRDIAQMAAFIDRECQPLDKVKYVSCIPTKNGKHLITTPFDLRQFREIYPKIDVHKNNPTVLYIPKSLDNEKQQQI